jgi:hypothetical protein
MHLLLLLGEVSHMPIELRARCRIFVGFLGASLFAHVIFLGCNILLLPWTLPGLAASAFVLVGVLLGLFGVMRFVPGLLAACFVLHTGGLVATIFQAIIAVWAFGLTLLEVIQTWESLIVAYLLLWFFFGAFCVTIVVIDISLLAFYRLLRDFTESARNSQNLSNISTIFHLHDNGGTTLEAVVESIGDSVSHEDDQVLSRNGHPLASSFLSEASRSGGSRRTTSIVPVTGQVDASLSPMSQYDSHNSPPNSHLNQVVNSGGKRDSLNYASKVPAVEFGVLAPEEGEVGPGVPSSAFLHDISDMIGSGTLSPNDLPSYFSEEDDRKEKSRHNPPT